MIVFKEWKHLWGFSKEDGDETEIRGKKKRRRWFFLLKGLKFYLGRKKVTLAAFLQFEVEAVLPLQLSPAELQSHFVVAVNGADDSWGVGAAPGDAVGAKKQRKIKSLKRDRPHERCRPV